MSASLKHFANRFESVEAIQLVHNLKHNESRYGVDILRASNWFADLSA